MLRVGRSKLYDLIRRGEVVSVLIGGSRRVPHVALAQHLQGLTAAATGLVEERRQEWADRDAARAGTGRRLSLPG